MPGHDTGRWRPSTNRSSCLMSGVEYGDEGLQRRFEGELRALPRAGPAAARVPRHRPDGDVADARPHRAAAETAPVPGVRAPLHLPDRRLHGADRRPERQEQAAADAHAGRHPANEATYFEQAARILDASKTELRHNSRVAGRSSSFPDIISLMSKFTVAEMLRRDNFRKRFDDGRRGLPARVPLRADAGLRRLRARMRRPGRRHGAALQPDGGAQDPGGRRPEAPRAGDDADPRRARRQGADVEVEGQPHRRRRPARGAVRQGDVDPGRGRNGLLHARDERAAGRVGRDSRATARASPWRRRSGWRARSSPSSTAGGRG